MAGKAKRGTDEGKNDKPEKKESVCRCTGLSLSCGLEVESILWFKVVEEPGKHGEGIFRVALGGDVEAAFLLEQDSPVALYDMDAVKPTVPLFAGVLERVEVSCMEGAYPEAELTVRSGTVLLDRREGCRVFQNPYGTCYDVFRHIAEETGCKVVFSEEDGLLGGPLFQYMETDWELLRRAAGRMGTMVVADTRNSRPGIYLGMPRRLLLPRLVGKVLESAMVFDGERYHALRGKGLEVARQDFICYDITTTENLELGDRVIYGVRLLVVCRREIGYSGSMVVFRCRLAGKTYASAVEECNPYLAGLTLGGSATRRVGEACGVLFDMGFSWERKVMDRDSLAAALSGEGAYLYPYAPVTGNLMYSMPEKGARVKVELLSCREGSAVISACLHWNCREPWEPGERLLCAEYDEYSRQLGITPASCVMGTHGVGSVSLSDEGVNLWTGGMLLMYAGEKIRVEGRVQALLRTRSGILANSGRQASSLWLGGRQDWLASYTVLHGRVYREHACYQDAPQKGHFNWGKYLVNVTQGLQVIVVVGGAALASKNKALSLAAISAAMKLCSMSVADYQSGNVRDTCL